MLDGPVRTRVGAPCVDAPLSDGFLLTRLRGQFTLMAINAPLPALGEVEGIPLRSIELLTDRDDPTGALTERYLGDAPQALYLIRPDQHIAARWSQADAEDVSKAMQTAIGKED